METPTSTLLDASSSIPVTNGASIEQPDVEMKEEQTAEPSLSSALHPTTASELPDAIPLSQPQSRPLTPARATATPAPPSQPNPHGSPTRVYLNQRVTPHLLEACKYLAVYEPEKPLKWLAEFLEQRSKEVEGG